MAYWVSENFIRAFENGTLLGNYGTTRKGMYTGLNENNCVLYLDGKQIQFKKKNKHNFTVLGDCNDISHIKIGNYTYGTINAQYFFNDSFLIIGSFCSIAKNVFFLIGGEHDYRKISTYPFDYYFSKKISKSNNYKQSNKLI